jgi:hypothetical protein
MIYALPSISYLVSGVTEVKNSIPFSEQPHQFLGNFLDGATGELWVLPVTVIMLFFKDKCISFCLTRSLLMFIVKIKRGGPLASTCSIFPIDPTSPLFLAGPAENGLKLNSR